MDNAFLTQHQEEFGRLSELIGKYRGRQGALIPVLQQAQDLFGYLPLEIQRTISEGLRIPLPEVYGVVKFYSQFTMVKKGHIASPSVWEPHATLEVPRTCSLRSSHGWASESARRKRTDFSPLTGLAASGPAVWLRSLPSARKSTDGSRYGTSKASSSNSGMNGRWRDDRQGESG